MDLPHAALADEGGDIVMAESGADFKRHELLGLIAVILYMEGQWLQRLHRMAPVERAYVCSEAFAGCGESRAIRSPIGADVPCVRFAIRRLSATCCTRHR